jgi:hypothetical protein
MLFILATNEQSPGGQKKARASGFLIVGALIHEESVELPLAL